MNLLKIILTVILLLSANSAAAYGSSSSSKKACKKPKFSQFTPPALAVVPAGSAFSFVTPLSTRPETIQVKIKQQPIEIQIQKEQSKYVVTGTLPADLTASHARINITATGAKKCKGSDGWLIKIAEQ